MFFQRLREILGNLEDNLSKIPTSLFGRGTKLLGVASKIAFEEVSSRLKTWENESEKLRSKVQLAQDVVKTLSQLKGASMKLGQLLSLDLGDYLPPEIVKVLGQLHAEATFLPYDEIETILRRELGERFHDFAEISERPIAAASIGQVHRAKLSGQEVVIKVQYPGVAESIPSDLRMLELLLKQASFLQGKRDTDLSPLLAEVEEVLIKEADYEHELRMHVKYREMFQGSPYHVPEPLSEYSTGKVLTQEFVPGLGLTRWLETGPSEAKRQEFAELLIKLYLEEIFVHGLVQTDPNPGNFIVTPDERLALIDFGAAREYGPDFVAGYRKILLASRNGDRDALLRESEQLGFIDPREEPAAKDIYVAMMDFLASPFRDDLPFDFSDKSYFTRSRDLSWEMSRKCKFTPPPKELIFLHRKLAGTFIFLKRLDIKIRLKDYWSFVEGAGAP